MKIFPHLLLSLIALNTLFSAESLIILFPLSNEPLVELGNELDIRLTPCSTFKVPLALIGFETGILKDS